MDHIIYVALLYAAIAALVTWTVLLVGNIKTGFTVGDAILLLILSLMLGWVLFPCGVFDYAVPALRRVWSIPLCKGQR